MDISNSSIDGGKPFDWGRASEDYARFRDIYPEEFYERLLALGVGTEGQRVLDLGTGTGVLPRNMYRFGARWTGADISPEQIAQARELSARAGMDISYIVSPAEEIDLPAGSLGAVTACQCFWYFDHERLMPLLHRLLAEGGLTAVMQLEWLPYEDELAARSEEIVLRYSPGWTGAGFQRGDVFIPDCAEEYFTVEARESFDLSVPFTRESWHGRMRACRGVGASLTGKALADWDREHREMLEKNAPEEFTVLHQAAIALLRRRDR